MRMLCIFIAATIISGCAPRAWVKQDATRDQIQQDAKACEYEGRKALAGSNMPVERAVFREAEVERLCMESRGYSRR